MSRKMVQSYTFVGDNNTKSERPATEAMRAVAAIPLLYLTSACALQLTPVVEPRDSGSKIRRESHLLAQAAVEPVPTGTGSIVAGSYSGIMCFTFAATCASVIFAPIGLPISIGIQHVLVGFVVTQAIVAKTTSVNSGVMIAVPSFEVLPFLSKFAVIVAGAAGGAGAAPGTILATILAGSIVCNVISAALLAVAAGLPVDNIERLLPPPLQAGLFAAIGWSLYMLSFDTLGLSVTASSLLSRNALRLWVPANLFGVLLWSASRTLSTPLLFPAFILAVSALVHGVRLSTGTSVLAAREAGWLMAEAVGEPAAALWRSLSPSLVRWDVIFSAAAFKQLVCAAIFGTLLNTVLNYLLYGPMIKEKLDLKAELRSHALGTAAAAAAGGCAAPLATLNTT
jgi:hypothetical protein